MKSVSRILGQSWNLEVAISEHRDAEDCVREGRSASHLFGLGMLRSTAIFTKKSVSGQGNNKNDLSNRNLLPTGESKSRGRKESLFLLKGHISALSHHSSSCIIKAAILRGKSYGYASSTTFDFHRSHAWVG